MTRRRLTPEEVELWHKVVEHTDRLHPERAPAPVARPKPKPTKAPVPRAPAQQPPAPPKSRPAPPSLRMDHSTFGRMKRGRLVPEARIDLHGMTLDAAHPALVRFILRAQSDGKRLVLVITGKGRPGDEAVLYPTPRGILRRQVPHWLDIPPLAQAVLQVTPAHIRHGGDGAFYVYLKRGR